MRKEFSKRARSKFSGGFTLLELMTAVTVLGILLAIGIPSFTDTIRSNRLTSLANELVTALNAARSEAAKRGIAVTVCASNAAQNACAGSAAWNSGWIVFTDDIGTAGNLDAGDNVLQVFAPPLSGFAVAPDTTVATTPSTLAYIRFLPRGNQDSGALLTAIKLVGPSCTGTHARQVAVANSGRISSSQVAC